MLVGISGTKKKYFNRQCIICCVLLKWEIYKLKINIKYYSIFFDKIDKKILYVLKIIKEK